MRPHAKVDAAPNWQAGVPGSAPSLTLVWSVWLRADLALSFPAEGRHWTELLSFIQCAFCILKLFQCVLYIINEILTLNGMLRARKANCNLSVSRSFLGAWEDIECGDGSYFWMRLQPIRILQPRGIKIIRFLLCHCSCMRMSSFSWIFHKMILSRKKLVL